MRKALIMAIALVAIPSTMMTSTCYSVDLPRQGDKKLSGDLARLQGVWEMKHGSGDNATRSVKTIKGNQVTIQRFDVATGALKGERSDEFVLGKPGDLRILTSYPIGGSPKEGTSHVYKIEGGLHIEGETLIEVTGLLQGDDEKAFPSRFSVSRWTRVIDEEPKTLPKPEDKDLAADLALLQGTWTMNHGNNGQGAPDTHSTRTIEGNKETLRRFDIATGMLKSEYHIEFTLSKSDRARVFTFYPIGGSPEDGASYMYKVDNETLIEVTGLLTGDIYQNYEPRFGVFRWKRAGDK